MTGDDGEPLGDIVIRRRAVPPEVRLWQAKVLQHVTDYLSPSQRPEEAFWRDHAREWLTVGSDQFERSCEMAGWDATNVIKRMNNMKDQPCQPKPQNRKTKSRS